MQSLNLSFKNPGTVKTVAVEQGQEVKEGQLLMAQEDLEQLSQLASARASLRSARARLAELENGSLPEEIAQLKDYVSYCTSFGLSGSILVLMFN
ncbi:MAG: biotin/lipoyl-binding protein [Bacillota bacterium]